MGVCRLMLNPTAFREDSLSVTEATMDQDKKAQLWSLLYFFWYLWLWILFNNTCFSLHGTVMKRR